MTTADKIRSDNVRPKNPANSLIEMAAWYERLGIRPEEVVSLSCDSFDQPNAHLQFSALLRLWPDMTFPVAHYSDSEGRPHVRFHDGPVRVVCLVEIEELAANRHRLDMPQPVEVSDG